MPHAAALADHDLQVSVARLEVEVEASLAIARATLTALASLSPVMLRQAETALTAEVEHPGRSEATAAALRACRDQLVAVEPKDRLAGALEQALINAAEVLASAERRRA